MRLLIIGGGITGLAAAWEGVWRGAQVTVVEASPKFGGKLVTDQVDGLIIERGPDSFVSYRPAAAQLAKEVGLGEEIIAAQGVRKVFLHDHGRLLPMPSDMGMLLPTKIMPFVTTPVLSWPDKFRASFDLVMARQLPPTDISIGTFLRRRLGDGIVRKFANPLVGGIYGATVDELSLDAVMPSLRQNENDHRSLMVASLAQGKAKREASKNASSPGGISGGANSPFRSFKNGLVSLPQALVAKLNDAGAELVTSRYVTRVRRRGLGSVATLNDGHEIECDAVIFAGGVASSQTLLAEEFPTASQTLGKIPLASTRLLTFSWPSSAFHTPPKHHGWLEIGYAPISGVTISSAKWENRADEETVLLRAFVPDKVGTAAKLSDEELKRTVIAHITPLLGARTPPERAEITHWRGVMPKYTVGHLDRVQAVEQDLAGRPSWRVAGSALYGVGIPDCISNGRATAVKVMEAHS